MLLSYHPTILLIIYYLLLITYLLWEVVSQGYFVSANCLRELLRALSLAKPLITLIEADERKGGMSHSLVLERLEEAVANLCAVENKAASS